VSTPNHDVVGGVIVAVSPSGLTSDEKVLFAEVADRPLLAWTVAAFERTPALFHIVLVVAPGHVEAARVVAGREVWRRTHVVAGGPGWLDAIFTGLSALPPDCSWVVVHEGARPLVTPELIAEGIAAAQSSGAATAAAPVKETLKRVERGVAVATPPRDRLALLHTPQVFARGPLAAAFQRIHARAGVLDAVTLLRSAGVPVATFSGGRDNMVVASRHDLTVVEAVLRSRPDAETLS
jgi:2-C-methyl-D-erythritol 4-phosphate cytidylyltransferase